jgi:hypothetical protein
LFEETYRILGGFWDLILSYLILGPNAVWEAVLARVWKTLHNTSAPKFLCFITLHLVVGDTLIDDVTRNRRYPAARGIPRSRLAIH